VAELEDVMGVEKEEEGNKMNLTEPREEIERPKPFWLITYKWVKE